MKVIITEGQYKLLTENELKSQILFAMGNDFIVQFEYNDPTNTAMNGRREGVIGHFGKTSAGNEAISVYQYDGVTSTVKPQWKTFLLSKIKSLNIRKDKKILQNTRNAQPARNQFNSNGHRGFSQVYQNAKFTR